MSAFTEIVAKVLGEHQLVADIDLDSDNFDESPQCSAGDWSLDSKEGFPEHQAEVITERLGVTELVEIGDVFTNGEIQPLAQQDPDGDWYLPPTHRRTVTAFVHLGEWEVVDA